MASMVMQQILSKLLNDKSPHILNYYGLTVDYFVEYEEEFEFIRNHIDQYGNVPDEATFLAQFPDFEVLEVSESEDYLLQTIEEEHLYNTAAPILNKVSELMQVDSEEGINYFLSQLGTLQSRSHIAGVVYEEQAQARYEEWLKRQDPDSKLFMRSSFAALDEATGGWRRGEELVVLFARTGHGKTFILLEFLREIREQGYRVGLIEPEMSPMNINFRMDTMISHVSNAALYRGYGAEAYKQHIDSIKESDKFFVIGTPKDFAYRISVPKLRAWCVQNKLDAVAVDGISYMQDGRAQRGDSRTVQLANIAQDLMDMSIELGIPVFVVAQANRNGVQSEAPGLDTIRDSDGIAYSATTVLSLRKTKIGADDVLMFSLEKTRNGPSNLQLTYDWDVDHGLFSEREEQEEQEQPAQITKSKQRQRPSASSGRPRQQTDEAF